MPDDKLLTAALQGGAIAVLILLAFALLIWVSRRNPNAKDESDKSDDGVKLALASLADKTVAESTKAREEHTKKMESFIERQTAAMEANTDVTKRLADAQISTGGNVQTLIAQVGRVESSLQEIKEIQKNQPDLNNLYNLAIEALAEAKAVLKRVDNKIKTKTQDLQALPASTETPSESS